MEESRDNPPKSGKWLIGQPSGRWEGVPISDGICASKEVKSLLRTWKDHK